MAIPIFRVFLIRDAQFVSDSKLPARGRSLLGNVAAFLTNLPDRGDGTSPWGLLIEIGKGKSARQVMVPLQPFLTPQEYEESHTEPFSFVRLSSNLSGSPESLHPDRVWLYRDALYATERSPRPSEIPEVIVRIKVLRFQEDEELRRLKEQLAHYEAVEENRRRTTNRKTLSDDVKLLVWSRDQGLCVRCGASKELHFDHVIPLSKGGSDEAVNIQLLCRACNLAKSDRIA